MSNKTKPIYNLSLNTINQLSYALQHPGKMAFSHDFHIGEFPKVTLPRQRVLPEANYQLNTKRSTNVQQTVHVYEMAGDNPEPKFIFFSPAWDIRKVNGFTTRAKEPVEIVTPANVKSVYVINASYPPQDFTIDNLELVIERYL